MQLPNQSPPVVRNPASEAAYLPFGIEPSKKCYGTKDCSGRVLAEKYDCHNCKKIGGKSLDNDGNCLRCV